MTHEIQLPPLPKPGVTDPGRFGILWGAQQMTAYARAAVLADREARETELAALVKEIIALPVDDEGRCDVKDAWLLRAEAALGMKPGSSMFPPAPQPADVSQKGVDGDMGETD